MGKNRALKVGAMIGTIGGAGLIGIGVYLGNKESEPLIVRQISEITAKEGDEKFQRQLYEDARNRIESLGVNREISDFYGCSLEDAAKFADAQRKFYSAFNVWEGKNDKTFEDKIGSYFISSPLSGLNDFQTRLDLNTDLLNATSSLVRVDELVNTEHNPENYRFLEDYLFGKD